MPPSEIDHPLVYRIGNFGKNHDPIAYESLSSRAWTLQERLLSPRVLHFERQQMYWECKKCFMSEDGTRFDPATFSLDTIIKAQAVNPYDNIQTTYRSFVPEAPSVAGGQGRFKGWFKVVSDYSKRRLTYLDDKLPALSGLANIIASSTRDTYLCGLWQRHIYQDLYWKMNRSEMVETEIALWDLRMEPSQDVNTIGQEGCEITERNNTRPLEIKQFPKRAPSWSWASMDGPVSFEEIQGDRITARLLNHEVKPWARIYTAVSRLDS